VGALNSYLMQTQRLVGLDSHQELFNLDDLIEFVNIGRQEVAAQGQCLRYVTPYQGSVMSIEVTAPGAGYVLPVVTITPPDQPSGAIPFPSGATATALAQQIGGMISSVGISFGGAGYFTPPLVTITDLSGPGEGATAVATLSPFNAALPGQEIYEFSAIDLSPAGYGAVLAVLGVSFLWGNWQWTANRVSLSKYMAVIRQWTTNFLAPPEWCCQQGQGVAGSLRLYPIPDQPYPMIWDALCLPQDLLDDTSQEVIPDPWRRAVPYYAAHLALLSRSATVPQLMPLAMRYYNEEKGGLFNNMMARARAFSQPGYTSSFYWRV
jgi:hypothetical protein